MRLNCDNPNGDDVCRMGCAGNAPCHYFGVEPSADDISRAWSAAIECKGFPGSQSETLATLIRLRNRKHTWDGNEVKLMFAIDRYIKDTGGQP